ncbi:acyl-CoA carboxylase subunit epsilon [Mycolicibacterium mucogenicum]|uniref:acyl-CoA carboxylase subunit epsilon n=1 Tax=Mycolicibacterium mucogenicum TaxID=56689 RepID=UPI00076A3893|nr:acyl-CoA carboxylase subunit epsilon [Mycolicibacterium mucogenicum]
MSNDVQTPEESVEAPVAPLFQVVKGNPSDEELAALVTVLASASGGGAAEAGDRNDWGHPVSKLRYAYTSWQLVTLVERTFIRR